MPIQAYVKAIEEGTFDPASILQVSDFYAQHRGQTLFQLLALRPNSHALFQATLLRYAILRDSEMWTLKPRDGVLPSSDRIYQCSLINQLTELMWEHYSIDELHQAALNPSEFISAMAFPGQTFISMIVSQIDSILIHFYIRYRYPVNEIQRIIKNSNTLDNIDHHTLSAKFLELANHPLYKSLPNSILVKIGQIPNYIRSLWSNIPEFQTTMMIDLKIFSKSIHDIKRIDLADMGTRHRTTHVQLLICLYYAGNANLQDEIIRHFNDIIQANRDVPAVLCDVVDALQKEECGLEMRLYLLKAAPIVSKLDSLSFMRLLYAGAHRLSGADQVYYTKVISTLGEVIQRHEITLKVEKNHKVATVRLAYLLAVGNIAEIHAVRVHLPYDPKNAMYHELCNIRSPKIVYGTIGGFNPKLLSELIISRYPDSPCMIEVGYHGSNGYSVGLTLAGLFEHGFDTVSLYIPREARRCLVEHDPLNQRDPQSVALITIIDNAVEREAHGPTNRPLILNKPNVTDDHDEHDYVMVNRHDRF